MTNLLKHVALISESDQVPASELMTVAAALQKQATRDLAPIWQVSATVDAFGRLEDMPVDYWPIIIRDDIGTSAAGFHKDNNGQPFALVRSAGGRDTWSLTCSHELCEMLVDPSGNRLVAGDSIKPGQGRVNYLVEVCDPSEHANNAYSVNGVLVSDFYTPNYFDPVAGGGVRYSFNGKIGRPRTILPGGYVSWLDLATGNWWQQRWFNTPQPTFRNLGKLKIKTSIRSALDRKTAEATAEALSPDREASLLAGAPVESAEPAANARAAALREQIGKLAAEA